MIAVGTRWAALLARSRTSKARDIDGALTTCGLVAGGIELNNYQLDGEYAIAKLLATTPIQLVNFFPDFGAGIAPGFTLQAVQNEASVAGRTRTACAHARISERDS